MRKTSPRIARSRSAESDEFLLREVVHRTIDALVIGKAPLREAMDALLTASAATCPSPLWESLRRLRWTNTAPRAFAAFERAVRRHPPPRSMRALFFSQPELDFGEWEIVWSGTADFRPDDLKCEFVTKNVRWPIRAAAIPVRALDRVRQLAGRFARDAERRGIDTGNEVSIPLFACSMGITCFVACEIAARIKPSRLVRGRRPVGIVAGPAGGEHHALGVITNDGWTPNPRCWLASRDPSFERDEDLSAGQT